MKINHVHAVYFSPTGNAKKVIITLAQAIADTLGVPMDSYDFTLPESREKVHTYGTDDLLVIGTPVYAGRIPNKMLPFVQTHFEGNGALAIPVAVFGNRNFDNGLIELRNELEAHGFHTIAGARPSTYSATSWQPDVQMQMISHRSMHSASRQPKRSLP